MKGEAMVQTLATMSATHVILVAQLMHSVGSGLNEFKKGLKEGQDALLAEAPVQSPTPPSAKPE
jgi:Sec-independent protein translocase protein TatA